MAWHVATWQTRELGAGGDLTVSCPDESHAKALRPSSPCRTALILPCELGEGLGWTPRSLQLLVRAPLPVPWSHVAAPACACMLRKKILRTSSRNGRDGTGVPCLGSPRFCPYKATEPGKSTVRFFYPLTTGRAATTCWPPTHERCSRLSSRTYLVQKSARLPDLPRY